MPTHHPRTRDAGLRNVRRITVAAAVGGVALTGGLAVMAEHAFSGVRKAVAETPTSDTDPTVATDPATTVPPITNPPITLPGAPTPITTAPQVIVPPSTVPAPAPTTRRHHHTSAPVVSGGS